MIGAKQHGHGDQSRPPDRDCLDAPRSHGAPPADHGRRGASSGHRPLAVRSRRVLAGEQRAPATSGAGHPGAGVARGSTVAGARAGGRQRGPGHALGQPASHRHRPRASHLGTGTVRAPAPRLRGAPDHLRSVARAPDAHARSAHGAPRSARTTSAGPCLGRAVATGTSASTPRTSGPLSGSRSRMPPRSSHGRARRSRRSSSSSG